MFFVYNYGHKIYLVVITKVSDECIAFYIYIACCCNMYTILSKYFSILMKDLV